MEALPFDLRLVDRAQACLRENWPSAKPVCALILGSGWGDVVGMFEKRQALDYSQIPGFGAAATSGHAGKLWLAERSRVQTLVMQGRRHWHEACGWAPVMVPIYLLKRMGVEVLFLTASVGGIRAGLKPGDLMLVEDHINFMGSSPLLAVMPEEREWDFVDLTNLYDRPLHALIREAAQAINQPLSGGILAATAGPAYETPAEVRMFRAGGADMCGMSTVPEAVLAHALKMRVAACACVTNLAAGLDDRERSHAEVLDNITRATDSLKRLLAEVWDRLGRIVPSA